MIAFLLDVREALARVAGRPPDFELRDLRRFAEANVLLLDGVRAKRTAAADGPVDRTRRAAIFDGHTDTRADACAIRFHADQFHRDPVVAVARILE